MSANASPRAQRYAVLESPLRDFDGWLIAIDCGNPECRRDRIYSLGELAGFYGGTVKVAEVLRRLRCQDCGGGVAKATLLSNLPTGRYRPRSLELLPGTNW